MKTIDLVVLLIACGILAFALVVAHRQVEHGRWQKRMGKPVEDESEPEPEPFDKRLRQRCQMNEEAASKALERHRREIQERMAYPEKFADAMRAKLEEYRNRENKA